MIQIEGSIVGRGHEKASLLAGNAIGYERIIWKWALDEVIEIRLG